jgi:DNA-3-methyladenine glycosylase
MKMIPLTFYKQEDVVFLAKALLGKYLFTCKNNIVTGGMIIETESYAGITDKASHAYNNRRTDRNEAMYADGGIAYIYLCYGMHFMFNIVTNIKDIPHAILIRAVKPLYGKKHMQKRLGEKKPLSLHGPGLLTKALGITMEDNKRPLNSSLLWLEDRGSIIKEDKIKAGPRIGVEYAKEDALLPWRFYVEE